MRLDVVTIFPEYLEPLRAALLGKAIERGLISVDVHDLRSWTHDVHKAVDDSPYGGGPGMVMKPTVWGPALDDVIGRSDSGDTVIGRSDSGNTVIGRSDSGDTVIGRSDGSGPDDAETILVVPTPAGVPFTQATAHRWSTAQRLVFACGRYEGIDQRVFDDAATRVRVEEVSIGDYVLIGGEAAVLVMVEAVVRLMPGVLGNQLSHQEDSFSDGLLEGPSYTRPAVWRDLEVPPVLLSGDHAKIKAWRREQSLQRTTERRPDLLP
ncbi:tRNA (guanine37-N1)-methyltransferase [Rhodococcus sp. 27YEA15]|uniref:tRNA (guanosine(37)-N1)-methyltransferase TrmD n=1 Tax=Rhodococcus sp. 27YEA15 TaxID=3156259 RepID=UPI003C7E9AE4